MKVRVYLATTRGPVQVERLTRERAHQSAVCLQRTTKVLAISGDYDAFVKRPSGVIEREFGPFEPGAFRLDVSAPIDEGDSWQLGVYAAHSLAATGRLALPEEAAKTAIWLTGSVDNDLKVGPVAHLAEKLNASRDEFSRLLADGISVTLFVPRGGRQLAERVGLSSKLTVVEVDSTADLEAALDLGADRDRPAGANAGLGEQRTEAGVVSAPRRIGTGWPRAILLVTLGGIGLAAILVALPILSTWRDLTAGGEFKRLEEALTLARQSARPDRWLAALAYETWLARDRPATGDVAVGLNERRPPEGRTCAAVHFGNVEAVTSQVTDSSGARFTVSLHKGLCGLEFAVVAGKRPLYAAASLQVESGRHFQAVPLPSQLIGKLRFSGRQVWAIDLPWRLREPFSYSLEVVAASYPVDGALRWWLESEDRARAAARAGELGLLTISKHHEVRPQ
jgi:hypothetical protein